MSEVSAISEVPKKVTITQKIGNWLSEKVHGPNPENLGGAELLQLSKNYNEKAKNSFWWAKLKGSAALLMMGVGVNDSSGIVMTGGIILGGWAVVDAASALHSSELSEKYEKLSDQLRFQ